MITPEQKAEKVAKELEKLQKKYDCKIGVWLTWRDLMHNFDIMKKDINLDELEFGLQIRIENGIDTKNKTSDKDTA